MKNDQKALIFISYSHCDRSVCESIASLLERPALEVWYDKGLIPGEIYRKTIADKLRNADYFVILLSHDSIRSEWVIDEIEYAKKQHKRILPVFLEAVTLPDDLDMILERYHSLFWHLRSSDRQFKENLDRIFGKREREDTDGQAQEKPGITEFSEAEIRKMRELLVLESQGAYARCYAAENALLLGKTYLYGTVCSIDRRKARFYFKTAKYYGSLDARAFLLVMSLKDQEEATWDEPDEAFCAPVVKELRSLAEQRSEAAMMLLAHILWQGRYGCAKDWASSAALYEECAKKGNARAQYIMSSNYYLGEGVPKDYDLAIMYANLALEQKYAKSWRRFGKFYRDGLAVPQDYLKARSYYERGAKEGDYNCYNKLGDMAYYGWGCERDYQQAYALYLKGEEAPENGQKYGKWKAKQALGRCLELGHGTEQNLEAAAEKYLEGYRLGSEECKADYIRLGNDLLRRRRAAAGESDAGIQTNG